MASTGSPDGWTYTVRKIDGDIFEGTTRGRTETLVRCTLKDVAAGVGMSTTFGTGLTKSTDTAFSAYYAQAVPTVCPDLRAADADIRRALTAAELGWADFLKRGRMVVYPPGTSYEEDAHRTMRLQEQNAISAVRLDAQELPDFCSEVERAFGEGGRVAPGLLIDRRRKA
ncbi:hypothetical protein [Methylobacterium nigriterrae]|uniref:hypothetical protein n=1 Tax=Methylobacterium nigriterrae TaxID=3127512 RepID=UPI0030138DCB